MVEKEIQEFSQEQIDQIDRVEEAVQNLIDAMTKKPDYMKNSNLKEYVCQDEHNYIIHPLELADIISNMLLNAASRMPKGPINIFFPTRVFDEDGGAHINDTFNETPVYEEGDQI